MKMLPIVFVLFILCTSGISAISDELKQLAQMVHDACAKETGVDESLIGPCSKGEFADDPKLKCYMKCLLDQITGMTDDGDIAVETLASMIPPEYREKAEPILRSCGTVKGADPCDTAFQTNKCWHSKNPEDYYLP